MEIQHTSRHAYSIRYRHKSGDFWGTRPPVKIPKSDSDEFHMVTENERNRIDLIAFHYYGDCALWWVIAEANGVLNPLELEVGRVLRIPAWATVQMKVLR